MVWTPYYPSDGLLFPWLSQDSKQQPKQIGLLSNKKCWQTTTETHEVAISKSQWPNLNRLWNRIKLQLQNQSLEFSKNKILNLNLLVTKLVTSCVATKYICHKGSSCIVQMIIFVISGQFGRCFSPICFSSYLPSLKRIFLVVFQAVWISHSKYSYLVENTWNGYNGNILYKLGKLKKESIVFNS